MNIIWREMETKNRTKGSSRSEKYNILNEKKITGWVYKII